MMNTGGGRAKKLNNVAPICFDMRHVSGYISS